MSVVSSYILRLRHDEKDDILPVQKIKLMTIRISNLSLLLTGISSSISDRRYPGQKKIFQCTQADSGFFEHPQLNRFDDESDFNLPAQTVDMLDIYGHILSIRQVVADGND